MHTKGKIVFSKPIASHLNFNEDSLCLADSDIIKKFANFQILVLVKMFSTLPFSCDKVCFALLDILVNFLNQLNCVAWFNLIVLCCRVLFLYPILLNSYFVIHYFFFWLSEKVRKLSDLTWIIFFGTSKCMKYSTLSLPINLVSNYLNSPFEKNHNDDMHISFFALKMLGCVAWSWGLWQV